ncbi:MAG: hypothetical protein JW704_11315, partial [Anaerolineaceae bacterium]|nr:hypothetical protein [Anaerolineaceae bacterium]
MESLEQIEAAEAKWRRAVSTATAWYNAAERQRRAAANLLERAAKALQAAEEEQEAVAIWRRAAEEAWRAAVVR